VKLNPDEGKSPETLAWGRGYAQGLANARAALAATPAPAPQDEREAFEAWAREYSTYPLERDDEPAFGTTGYTSMEQTMLWDAWQARAEKAKAPEGASRGDLDANARPGLAGANDTCRHEFALSPSSGILLCAKCGIGEVAANKQARAAHAATPAPAPLGELLTDEEIDKFALDLWMSESYLPVRTFVLTVVHALTHRSIGKEAGNG